MSQRSLLLVHAHPDDETINNGATMAKYVSEGARVTLVTCTRGEEGEVRPQGCTYGTRPGRRLRPGRKDDRDSLGQDREIVGFGGTIAQDV